MTTVDGRVLRLTKGKHHDRCWAPGQGRAQPAQETAHRALTGSGLPEAPSAPTRIIALNSLWVCCWDTLGTPRLPWHQLPCNWPAQQFWGRGARRTPEDPGPAKVRIHPRPSGASGSAEGCAVGLRAMSTWTGGGPALPQPCGPGEALRRAKGRRGLSRRGGAPGSRDPALRAHTWQLWYQHL